MAEITNDERRARARIALDAYLTLDGVADNESTAIVDLMADLAHLAESLDDPTAQRDGLLDGADYLDWATRHYSDERTT